MYITLAVCCDIYRMFDDPMYKYCRYLFHIIFV